MKSKILTIFSILGIIAPLALFISVTLLSIFAPNYNFVTEYISILGSDSSPFKFLVNIFGFGLFGIIMIGFALALENQLKAHYFTTTGTRLFLGGGMIIFILAFFPTNSDYSQITFDGRMHSILGNTAFLMIPISIIWFGLAFKKDDNWDNLWRVISFSLAGIALVAAAIMGIFPHYTFNGSIERLGIGAVWLWMFLVSINLVLSDQLNRFANRKG
jgi:hypothetical membrane protein